MTILAGDQQISLFVIFIYFSIAAIMSNVSGYGPRYCFSSDNYEGNAASKKSASHSNADAKSGILEDRSLSLLMVPRITVDKLGKNVT